MTFLDDYFKRLNLSPFTEPTLANLRSVMVAQMQQIPFENIDVVQKKEIDISPDAIHDKLVKKKRGGYCWELNLLILRALEELKYDVALYGNKVRWNKQPDQLSTYTHNHLIVTISPTEHWLVDVGFAGTNSVAPIRLDNLGEVQVVPEGSFRVIRDGHNWLHLQWEIKGEFRSLYKWHDVVMDYADCEMSNFYSYAWEKARFPNQLCLARLIGEGERHYILNSTYGVRHLKDGSLTETKVNNKAELLALLNNTFGIELDDDENVERFL